MAFGASSSDEGLRNRVLAEVAAVSATPEFERAPVMRRLLGFLVRTTLAGNGDDLKAYSVAVDGLGRDADFDSQSDSYPRVQVGRLRKMLDAYYGQNKPTDGVRLRIRTGGYRVHFDDAAPPEPEDTEPPSLRILPDNAMRGLSSPADPVPAWVTALTPGRVVVLSIALVVLMSAIVLALSPSYRAAFLADAPAAIEPAPIVELGAIDISGDPAATVEGMRVRALLGDALHRSWIVRVRDMAGLRGSAIDGGQQNLPDYRLAGQIVPAAQAGQHRLYLMLWDARTGNQIWSEKLLLPPSNEGLAYPLRPIISTLIRPFGVIARQERLRKYAGGATGYRCLLEYEVYFRDRDPAQRNPIDRCIAETIRLDPMNAPALAAASFLAFDPAGGGGKPQDRVRAADLARRAVAADPYSAEAHVADARVAIVAGQCRRGTESADRALALNPYTPEVMGLIGFLLYQCGDPRAETMLRNAMTLDPDLPAFYSIALVLSLIEHGKIAEALDVADSLRPPGPGMAGQYAITQMIARTARGDRAGAIAQWPRIVAASGRADGPPDQVLGRFLFSHGFRAKLIAYLASKGALPPAPR